MILDLRGPGWRHHRSVAVRGRAFDRSTDRLLGPTEIADRLADALEIHRDGHDATGDAPAVAAIAAIASRLDGFYAAAVGTEESKESGEPTATMLVADGARTVPLYFGVDDATSDESRLVVSDRGRVVRDALGADVDPVAEGEFLLTRYVTDAETIWKGVRSTRAGEIVAVDATGAVRSVTYRDHRPGLPEQDGTGGGSPAPREAAETARSGLDEGLKMAFDRLERIAGDRPIVVPLSGGYDSRLVASELVARDREVIAYTFGRSGHPDVEVSREVAARLGIDWRFVPYDADVWSDWYGGSAGDAYETAAFGGDALPFLAEWPALRTLVAEDRIPRDALWCPGHTVATPGERLPAFADNGERSESDDDGRESDDPTVIGCGPATDATSDAGVDDREEIAPTIDALVDYVRETHYDLWRWEDDRFREAVDERIRRGLTGDVIGAESKAGNETWIDGPEAAAAAYERWEWRGRMTTFTNGDLRAYEDAGLDWWLPLWDPAYVRAYASLPRRFREGKRLHASLAIERYRKAATFGPGGDAGGQRRDGPANRAALTDRTLPPVDRHLSLCRHTPVRQFTERDGRWDPPYLAPRSAWSTRGCHPLAWDAIVDPALHERLPQDPNLYALRTLATTGRIDLDDPERIPDGLFVSIEKEPAGVRLRLPTEERNRGRSGR